jgi:hypothetical protein
MVGPTSITWLKCGRTAPWSRIRAGQWTTAGLRVPPRWEATCLPHWKGALPAQAHAAEKCGAISSLPHTSSPPYRWTRASCCSEVGGTPFCMVSSLNEPVTLPSIEEPLSPQIQTTRVFSISPISEIASRTRPTL